ncbi:unnamed protein product, partial [marine sediment metagenome]
MAKSKAGQPTKYKPEHCQALIDFFDIEPYEDREIPHYDKKTGEIVVWTDIKRMPNKLPTLRDFAKSINVSIRAVYNWLDEKNNAFQEEFLHTFIQAKDIRKDFLIQNGLQGMYPPLTFKFVAINLTDMVDQSKTELS